MKRAIWIALAIAISCACSCSGATDGITGDNFLASLDAEPGDVIFLRERCIAPIDVPGCEAGELTEGRGTCDTQTECDTKVDELCEPFGGVDKYVPILTRNDGTKECSADCADGDRIVIVVCGVTGGPGRGKGGTR